jgi:hypothetical protein
MKFSFSLPSGEDMLPSSGSASAPTNLPGSTPPSALSLPDASAVAAIPPWTGQDVTWTRLGVEIVKQASKPALNLNANARLESTADRAFALGGASDVSIPSALRVSLTPRFIGGAGSVPGAADLFDGALTIEDRQASGAATDRFFSVFAAQPLSAE